MSKGYQYRYNELFPDQVGRLHALHEDLWDMFRGVPIPESRRESFFEANRRIQALNFCVSQGIINFCCLLCGEILSPEDIHESAQLHELYKVRNHGDSAFGYCVYNEDCPEYKDQAQAWAMFRGQNK